VKGSEAMPTITREIELTPADVVQVLRGFGREEWQELQFEIQASLFLEDVDVSELVELFALLPYSEPVEPCKEEWEPLPEEPPPTPEGDRIALEAVERMAGIFPITDPDLGRWLAESPDLSPYGG
jgi:hypothetical protein